MDCHWRAIYGIDDTPSVRRYSIRRRRSWSMNDTPRQRRLPPASNIGRRLFDAVAIALAFGFVLAMTLPKGGREVAETKPAAATLARVPL
jgi:hypothetical protein